MEASSRASRSRNVPDLFKNSKIPFALALIVADAILVALIIAYVPCQIYFPSFFYLFNFGSSVFFFQIRRSIGMLTCHRFVFMMMIILLKVNSSSSSSS